VIFSGSIAAERSAAEIRAERERRDRRDNEVAERQEREWQAKRTENGADQ